MPFLSRSPLVARLLPVVFIALLVGIPASPAQDDIPTPEEVIGFEPGTDYKLADNSQLEDYYRELAAASERIELETIGETHQGRDLLMMYISSEDNLEERNRWRAISETLGRADGLDDEEARELAEDGKPVVWIDHGLHSAELAVAQSGPHLAYHLATDASDETLRILDDVMLLMMPVMNPDGQDIVVDWWREVKDTPFAETVTGTGPPWVWHEYIDHDNNRDWYMLLQNESRAVADVIYNTWYPQIVVNHHQMGEMPPRMFVPQFADPVNPHIPPLTTRGTNLVGEHMANRYAGKDMPGVIQGITFNMWWNGGMRTAPYFHNMVGILTESTHRSPLPKEWDYDEDIPEHIVRGGEEIPMKRPTVNYPNPWEGGETNLMEMVDYHVEGSLAILDIASQRSEEWLYNFYQMGRDAIETGEDGDPYAYVVPEEQWDAPEAVEMLRVLDRGGIEMHRATDEFTAGDATYPAGTYVLYAGQAFQAHLKDMLERQEYPDRRLYPDGPPEPPYDMAGWTLPIQMGVDVDRIDEPFDADVEEVDEVPPPEGALRASADYGYALSSQSNMATTAVNRLLEEGYTIHRTGEPMDAQGETKPEGTFVIKSDSDATRATLEAMSDELGLEFTGLAEAPDVDTYAIDQPEIAKYKSWVRNIDGGWARWVLDTYEVPYDTLHNERIQGGDLGNYDVLMMPAQNPESIQRGHEPGSMPEEYVGGLGAHGATAIDEFVRDGGTVVAWDGATDFLIDQLELPVRNNVRGVAEEDFFIPGSLVQLEVDTSHPVGFGMQETAGAWFVDRRGSQSRSFEIIEPAEAEDRRAEDPPVEPIAWFDEEEVLQSGWAQGEEEHLAGKPAAVRVEWGAGDLVLLGVRPHFRGQPRDTFKLLFNGLQLGATEGVPAVDPTARE